MVYTELQKRGGKKYFYLVHTVRIDSKFKKLRVFLGVNLDTDRLKKEIENKKKILEGKVSAVKEAESKFKMGIGFSQKLFSREQKTRLDALKDSFQKSVRLADRDILKNVRESFLITYTFNTNAAEGNTITLKETELILKKGIAPKSHSLREIYEIENTMKAYEYMETYDGKLNHEFILKLHELITKNTLENSKNEGRYRKKGQNVAMLGSKHFPPKGGRQIKKLMEALINEFYSSELHIIESAILFHSAFILIHPYIDGNGRVSRAIFNWILLKNGYPQVSFSSAEHIEYTDLLELSRDGDSKPLAEYIFEKLINSEYYMSTKKS